MRSEDNPADIRLSDRYIEIVASAPNVRAICRASRGRVEALQPSSGRKPALGARILGNCLTSAPRRVYIGEPTKS